MGVYSLNNFFFLICYYPQTRRYNGLHFLDSVSQRRNWSTFSTFHSDIGSSVAITLCFEVSKKSLGVTYNGDGPARDWERRPVKKPPETSK